MRSNFSSRALALLGGVFLVAPAVPAHTKTGTLGANVRFVDYYVITCSDDGSGVPRSLSLQIRDDAPLAAPVLEVLVRKAAIATSINAAPADPGVFSPVISLNGGAGSYDVFVRKTGAAAENYTLSYHCMTGLNGTGLHTGTDLVQAQNQ